MRTYQDCASNECITSCVWVGLREAMEGANLAKRYNIATVWHNEAKNKIVKVSRTEGNWKTEAMS